MTPWYLEDPQCLQREREALSALEKDSPWLKRGAWILADGDLAYDFDIEIGGQTYELRLVYPDLFPDAAAWVLTRDNELISGHQFVSGPLCLEHRADTWHAGITGAMLVQSAHKLLAVEKPGLGAKPGAVVSSHRTTHGERLRKSTQRGAISLEGKRFLASMPSGTSTPVSFTMPMEMAFQRAMLASVQRGGVLTALADVPDFNAFKTLRFLRYDGYALRGNWAELPQAFESNKTLMAYLAAQGFVALPDLGATEEKHFFVLLVDAAGAAFRLLFASTNPGSVPFEFALIVSDDTRRRLPEVLASVVGKRVAIIGCGSLGSKVAVSLARSGVNSFLLVDHDILRPENLVRNELDWWHVGMHKVHALRDRLNLVAGGIDTEVIDVAAGSALSSRYMSSAYERIGACDLIVDATARPVVFERLAGIARRRAKPLVWGELFAGGIGGIVARGRPAKDGSPLQVRHSILKYLDTLSKAPHRAAMDYDDVDTTEPVVAGDAEVSFLASIVSQFAVDALIEPESSRFPYAAYLFGLRAEWDFQGPFEFTPIETPGPAVAVDPDGDAAAEAVAFLKGLNAKP